MLNDITIIGRVVKDPELRHASDTPCCTFPIANDRDYKKGDEQISDFFDIVTWRNTAEFVSRNIFKGRLVAVKGRLQVRTWTDKEGNRRKAVEIVADSVYPLDRRAQTGVEQFENEEEDDGNLPF